MAIFLGSRVCWSDYTRVEVRVVESCLFLAGKVEDVEEVKAPVQAAGEEKATSTTSAANLAPGAEDEAGVPNPFDFSAMTGLLNVCMIAFFACHIVLGFLSLPPSSWSG